MPFSGRIRSLIQGLRNAGKIEQRYAEDLESLNTKKRQALEKLSARDYLPRIPHPDGPDAPFM